MKFKFFASLLVCFILQLPVQAQLVVDNSITLDEAIAILLGPDVEFFNVTFSGDADQIGSFNSTNSNVGIPTGIMMGTGNVNAGIGPNNSGSDSEGGGNSGASDADLDDLDGLTHNDAAILEFDFIATGSTVSFDYVWASEEYPEYSGADGDGDGFSDCGNVSDVFGFFLSGPGINGPFTNNATNIALIPGSTDFVSIFNLNGGCEGNAAEGDIDCNYCEFYVYNGDGFTAPYNETGSIYVQYDGLTVILTAFYSGLQCGETYHIKLALADVSDTAFDSAVFLKEGSFDVSGSLIDAFVLNPSPDLGDNTILEGCIDGNFVIHPPGCQTEPLTVTLFTSGNATSGVDYQGIPESITLDGVDVVLPISSILDEENEGSEDITVYFVYLTEENVLDTAEATLYIVDYNPPTLVVNDINVCGPTVATATITSGFGPYTYNWSSGGTGPTETYYVGEAGTYTLSITDHCGTEVSDAFQVIDPVQPSVTVNDINICGPTMASASIVDGVAPYTYNWSSNGNGPTDEFNTGQGGQYTLNVIDDCGSSFSDEFEVFEPQPISIEDPGQICVNELTGSLVTNGQLPYSYVYDSELVESFQNAQFVINTIGNYTIPVTDACGMTGTIVVEVVFCDTEIPNVFTPNGDALNDAFVIRGIEQFPNSQITIWNRWGKIVYESTSYNNSWTAKDEPDGLYYYVLQRSDGKNFEGYVHRLGSK
jgi:gliding motility-associated-like protein